MSASTSTAIPRSRRAANTAIRQQLRRTMLKPATYWNQTITTQDQDKRQDSPHTEPRERRESQCHCIVQNLPHSIFSRRLPFSDPSWLPSFASGARHLYIFGHVFLITDRISAPFRSCGQIIWGFPLAGLSTTIEISIRSLSDGGLSNIQNSIEVLLSAMV